MGIIKGKKLMVFIKQANDGYKSIGYATNHTFSTSAATIDVAHKDLADAGSGRWDDQDVDTFSWTITSENFYADSAEGETFATLFSYYSNGTELDLKFTCAADSTSGVPTGGWTPASSAIGAVLSGKAIITSLDINASVSDNASFTVTFTGKGALTAS